MSLLDGSRQVIETACHHNSATVVYTSVSTRQTPGSPLVGFGFVLLKYW